MRQWEEAKRTTSSERAMDGDDTAGWMHQAHEPHSTAQAGRQTSSILAAAAAAGGRDDIRALPERHRLTGCRAEQTGSPLLARNLFPRAVREPPTKRPPATGKASLACVCRA